MPSIYVFDVNETLLDLRALDPLLTETFDTKHNNGRIQEEIDTTHLFPVFPRLLFVVLLPL